MKNIFRILPPLVVFLVAFALFAPSIAYPLLDYDDVIFITRNNLVLGGLSLRSVCDAFTSLNADAAMYSPLLWLSWMFDVSVFGATPSNPWAFHLGNVLLHAINAVLLWFILRRFRATPWVAVLLALLWACHPLRGESVAWATERKDTLSTFFAFLSILFYLKAFPALAIRRARKRFIFLALAAFVAGLLVKPMLVTLPFLFLLFDVFPLRRISLDRTFSIRAAIRLLLEKLPLFALSVAASVVSMLTQARGIHHGTPILSRLALIPLHYAFYLIKTFIPIRLTPFYHSIVFTWNGIIPFCLLFAALFVSAWRRRNTHPAWSVGIFAFFGLAVPVIGVFHVGIHHIADRYSYLPAIGLSIAAVPILCASSKPLRLAASSIATLLLLALVPVTVFHIRTWSSPEVFYDRAEAVFPNHPYVVAYRARQLITNHGDFAAAEPLLDAAIAEFPDNDSARVLKAVCIDERLGPEAAFDFYTSVPASTCSTFELREAAQYAFRAGKPELVPSIIAVILPLIPKSDALREDIRYLELAIAFESGDETAMRDAAAKIPKLANRPSVTMVDLFPHYANQWSHLHRTDAWNYFRRAAQLPVNTPADINNLAWLLSTAAGWNPAPPEEVLAIAQRAADLAPDHPVILDTLAAAYANASDFPSAVETASRALELAAPDPALYAQIQSRIDLYRRNIPFRESD